eukprot:Nitzschia sp. Nitz4//scaffold10_size219509//45900//47349//NITZ4_001406-RA/size219509-augustus-gene-0.266-mRNA-1//-1//CDS//3329532854//7792//frame0
MSGLNPNDSNDQTSKRAALAGQWRTPPMPAYPGYSSAAPVAPAPTASVDSTLGELPAPTKIPMNSVDYAKALQAAYRQGAEAARLAQQQQLPNSVSCPNFQSGPNAPVPHSTQPTGVMPEEAAYQAQQQQQQQSHQNVPDPMVSTSMIPPHQQPQHPHILQQQQQQQQQQQHSNPGMAPNTNNSVTNNTAPVAAPPMSSAASRSVSMPDMSAYAAQAEEEKRQKRLARNRASARQRRLRKKNLVEAYETEVGILEKTLKQLKAHEWGRDDDHAALLEALGMERGQQAIPPEQRTNMIKDIMSQQMEQVTLLQQAQREQECLSMLAMFDPSNPGGSEDAAMLQELEGILQLTPNQKQQLRDASHGLDAEVQALETVAASLQAMQENDWLLNEGVQSITDQFTAILHKNQVSKFLLWTDANAEAIDQLDHVQVQPLQGAPLFTFGVESTPGDDDEK